MDIFVDELKKLIIVEVVDVKVGMIFEEGVSLF